MGKVLIGTILKYQARSTLHYKCSVCRADMNDTKPQGLQFA
jgi:hypothetical protein